MTFTTFKPVLYVLLFSVLAFLIHNFAAPFVSGYDPASKTLHNSLLEIYTFFGVCSVLIISIFIIVKQVEIDNSGNSFILLTLLKMAAAYGFFYGMLTAVTSDRTEKLNFFIVFAIFLAMETIISVRILNNKQ